METIIEIIYLFNDESWHFNIGFKNLLNKVENLKVKNLRQMISKNISVTFEIR